MLEVFFGTLFTSVFVMVIIGFCAYDNLRMYMHKVIDNKIDSLRHELMVAKETKSNNVANCQNLSFDRDTGKWEKATPLPFITGTIVEED